MIVSKIVHVASKSPSVIGDGGEGHFQWFETRTMAASFLAGWIVEYADNPSVNFALTTLEVPAYESSAKITDWLDAHWHLIEVALHSD